MPTMPIPPTKSPVKTHSSQSFNYWLVALTILQILTLSLVVSLVFKNNTPIPTPVPIHTQGVVDLTQPPPTHEPVSNPSPMSSDLIIILSSEKDEFDFGEAIQISAEVNNIDNGEITIELIGENDTPVSSQTVKLLNQKANVLFEQPFNGIYLVGEWIVRAKVPGKEEIQKEIKVIIKRPAAKILVTPDINLGDGYVIIPELSVIKLEIPKVKDVDLALVESPTLKLENENVNSREDGTTWILPKEILQSDTPGSKTLSARLDYAQIIDASGKNYIDDTMSVSILTQGTLQDNLYGRELFKYDFQGNSEPNEEQVILRNLTCADAGNANQKRPEVFSLGPADQYPDYLRIVVIGWINQAALAEPIDPSQLPLKNTLLEPYNYMSDLFYPTFPSNQFCVFGPNAGNSITYVFKQSGDPADYFQIVLLGLVQGK